MEETQQDVAPGSAVPPQPTEIPSEILPETGKKAVTGPAVAVVIALAAVVLGGLYLWGSTLPEPTVEEMTLEKKTETAPVDNATTSDEIGDLEAELKSELSGMEEDFSEIDSAFEAGA